MLTLKFLSPDNNQPFFPVPCITVCLCPSGAAEQVTAWLVQHRFMEKAEERWKETEVGAGLLFCTLNSEIWRIFRMLEKGVYY